MQVNELMAGPVDACGPDATMAQAARKMTDDDIGSIAITKQDELLGIITERDIVRGVAFGCLPSQTKVSELMTPQPDCLEPDVSVEDAASWMLAAGYRHLPVVASGRVMGMVSMKDLMWELTDRLTRVVTSRRDGEGL
jgi:CBS domain-containing protein